MTSHLRVYAWVMVVAVLVAVALNATPQARSIDPDRGWEILPDSCKTPTACTPNHPAR